MNSTARIPRLRLIETPKSVPQYEVRIRHHGLGDTEIEVWRMPSPATPQLTSPTRLAGLRGEALELVEHRVFKQMQRAGLRISSLRPVPTRRQAERQVQGYNIPEELALTLGSRSHGERGGQLLAQHGHPPEEPAAGADRSPLPANRSPPIGIPAPIQNLVSAFLGFRLKMRMLWR
jgi:hypothetical protein